MKIDSPDAEIFKGFDPNVPFESKFLDSSRSTILETQHLQSVLLVRNWNSFQDTLRYVAANTALNQGIPPWAIDGFRNLFSELRKVPAVNQLLSDALTGVKGAVNDAVRDALAAVPYVRLVVNLGVAVLRLVQAANARAAAASIPADADLVYSRDGDSIWAAQAIEAFRSGSATLEDPDADLTELFYPPFRSGVLVHEWENTPITWTAGGTDAQGLQIKLKGIRHPGGVQGFGCLPGLFEQEGWYEYAYEYQTQTGIGWVGSPYTTEITPYGQIHPSLRQLAGEIWQLCCTPGPTMFQLDYERIADGWDTYYRSLWSSMPIGKEADIDRGLQQLMRMCSAGVGGKARRNDSFRWQGYSRFSGIPLNVMRDIRPPDPEMLDASKHAPPWPMNRLIRRIIRDQKRRVKHTLGTIVCAYVRPTAPALRDPELQSYHAQMRGLLLSHPARCLVEPDLVPDPDYRQLIIDAQGGPAHPFAYSSGVCAEILAKMPRKSRAAIDPEAGPEPPPGPVGVPVPDAGDGAVVGALLALAGLGALGYALTR